MKLTQFEIYSSDLPDEDWTELEMTLDAAED